MKKHVADLKHCRALVSARIVVGSYFQWCWYEKSPITGNPTTPLVTDEKFNLKGVSHIPAPLPCELMEILNEQETAYVARAFTAVTNRLVQCPFNTTLKLITANMLCDMLLWMKGQGLLNKGTEGEG